MENKQIIIDNIDVSGCEYYFDEKCRCMDASIMQDFYSCPQCNSNPNCNYKKWQRKEQECERLKQTLAEIKDVLKFYANSKIGQQQEDGSYKILLNDSYITIYDPEPAREALQKISECDELDNEAQNLFTEKYKKALQEIKEIAEKFYYQELGNRDCMNCDDYCFDKILQKISEVLE